MRKLSEDFYLFLENEFNIWIKETNDYSIEYETSTGTFSVILHYDYIRIRINIHEETGWVLIETLDEHDNVISYLDAETENVDKLIGFILELFLKDFKEEDEDQKL